MIQHNMAAMNANRQLGINTEALAKSTEKLSSGYRINRAADDAAGLAISEKMNSRIRALKRCQNNIEEGIGLAQTADGALQEVNNMLVRVHELCVQAANGTNTEDDRSLIADEIDQIYEEMDRIFEDTEYNTILVFRNSGINFNAEKTGYNYKESVTKLPSGQYKQFGEMDGLPRKQFELAEQAKGASVTMTLDSGIDLNDASTLVGKTFSIDFKYEQNGYEYNETVRYDFSNTTSGHGYEGDTDTLYTFVNSSMTVQDAFDKLVQNNLVYSPFSYIELENAIVSRENGVNYVKLQLSPNNFVQSILTDGKIESYSIVDGYGSYGNKFVLHSLEGSKIEEIDSQDNQIKYSKDISMEWNFYTLSNPISEEQKQALKESYLELEIDGNINRVSFSDAEIDVLQSPDDLMKLIMEKLEGLGCEVSFNGSQILISKRDCVSDTQSKTSAHIQEGKEQGAEKNSSIISINILETISPTMERAGEWTIELPENIEDSTPVSLNINGRIYTFYNHDTQKTWIKALRGETWSYSGGEGDLEMRIASVIAQNVENVVVTYEENKIVLKAEHANERLNVSLSSETVQYYEYGIMPSQQSFDQAYRVSLNFAEVMQGGFDIEKLYGRGFEHNEAIYKFSNGSSVLSGENVICMDISSCNCYADIAVVVENVLKQNNRYPWYYDYEVVNAGGIIEIKSSRTMDRSSSIPDNPTFRDGYIGIDGVFNDTAGTIKKNFSGGTDTTQPYAEIDFSKYNAQNKSKLYGKGFRVTCATCPGEFINVMFCEDKSECEIPESFEYEYTDETGKKTTTTIKNYIVELKDVSSGSQIVDSIVRQLEGEMNHFTEVDADGTMLIVRDKRAGNIYDEKTGEIRRAEVIPGIYANYVYTVEPEKGSGEPKKEYIYDNPKKTEAYYSFIMIYASDTADDPYIPLHLPYLTLDNLLLEPVSEYFKTQEGVEKVMLQAKNAASVISRARSKIGADQNRLEHAFESAANAEIQITDAYSRIKDADMASEMVMNAKWNILQQTAQTILSQNVQQSERVLNLLQ